VDSEEMVGLAIDLNGLCVLAIEAVDLKERVSQINSTEDANFIKFGISLFLALIIHSSLDLIEVADKIIESLQHVEVVKG
jgi:hypothetical protein